MVSSIAVGDYRIEIGDQGYHNEVPMYANVHFLTDKEGCIRQNSKEVGLGAAAENAEYEYELTF